MKVQSKLRKPHDQMPKKELGCYNCSQIGHKASECPTQVMISVEKEQIKESLDMEVYKDLKDEILNN